VDRELRRQQRLSMRGVPERLGLQFAQGNIEMRAKPNGTAAGSNFEWRGYATVYDADFPMWDPWGEPYTEYVAQGAAKRSLANPALDVPFLIGHNDAGIPLARTKSGTMQLSEDPHGVFTHVPEMDGRREEVRALASAVERGDMDEMSLAFVCQRQEWDAAFERRGVLEMDLHRGDVCAVVHGANVATAGAAMFPVEQLSFRRPAAIGGPVLLEYRATSMAVQHGHPGRPCIDPDGDGDCDATPEGDTDHDYWTADGRQIKPLPGEERAAAVLRELLSVTAAERDKAKAAGNSLPDGSYPINNVGQLHAAAVLAASHHGDWKAAQALIRRRAKELGVDVTTLPGFGEEKSAGMPLELRASAADDINLANATDYDVYDAPHPMNGSHTHAHSDYAGGTHTHEHSHAGDGDHGHGHSASVMVDDSTGIPGEETQFAARRKLELMARELELEELAAAR
jgi:HK97 family phage prohead protease